jgi:hypothetical protein
MVPGDDMVDGFIPLSRMIHDPWVISAFTVQTLACVGALVTLTAPRLICFVFGCKTKSAYTGGETNWAGECSRCKSTDPAQHHYPLL